MSTELKNLALFLTKKFPGYDYCFILNEDWECLDAQIQNMVVTIYDNGRMYFNYSEDGEAPKDVIVLGKLAEAIEEFYK